MNHLIVRAATAGLVALCLVAVSSQAQTSDDPAKGSHIKWAMAGRFVGNDNTDYNPNVDNTKGNRPPPWLIIDQATGRLSGTPPLPGVNLVLISAQIDLPNGRSLVDTRQFGIIVRTPPAP